MTDCPPDLVNSNPDFSALLAQKGTLQEIESSKLVEFTPDVVEALKYNGKTYSIPWYATSAITIYNKDLFNKSGLIRLPKTYKELASVSEKIKANTGAYSYLPTITENDTMVKILNKYGITEIEDFNTKESQKIFEMFKKLYQNGLIPPETITMTHREALEQYMAGKTVFYQGGANFLNMIKENAPKIYAQTDVTEQIKGPLGQNDFSVMNFVIPLRAKHKQEALDF
jgi:putative chitobiose transport system substrate-binding protein